MSTFVYTDTVAAQCAIWNTAINPASGQPYNTIETASGSVIGVANLQTGVAETQEGTPLSQGGLQCVVKGDQVFHPDDLDNPLDVDSEDQDQDGIPDICAIIGDLPICTPEPPPGGDGTTDGGGDTGGGGNVGGGGGTGNNGSGSGGGKPQEFTTNPATLGSNQANQSADLALVAGSSGDRMLCEGGKRNCEHTNLGAGLGQELRLGLDRAPQIIDRRKLEDNPFDLIDQESAKEGESIRPNLGKVFGYANHSTIPAATSLSVDDEVLKTAMAVYTPLRRLRADFLNDPNSVMRILTQRSLYAG